LKLIVGGVFPHGDLQMRAKRMLCAALARPGFLSAYAAQAGVGREEAAASIAGQLEKTGVPAEETLRLFAA
jgi:hypothetical protein